MEIRMRKCEKICTRIGLLLLSAALFLTVYNLWSDAKAGELTDTVLGQLITEREMTEEKAGSKSPETNLSQSSEETYIPDYILNPEMEMPTEEIDGREYIGVLRIPVLSLELPIISEWNYPSLRVAPCRYSGSAYLNNMVIAAHNYRNNFGRLKNLSPDDEIIFTDMDGNMFRYKVVEFETLSPFAIEDMTDGDWDLTLFTCTVGGQSRVTVRCRLTEDGN